jgi:diguanylate cyclase (GGDEF)-like protein
LLDLDHFKKINDQYGHPVGDVVLKWVSEAIQNSIRDCDYAARYGGEEFAVVLPETEIKGAALAAERMRKAVENLEIATNGLNIDVTISIGVTCYQTLTDKKDKSEIISEADKALYRSKSKGRNKTCVHNYH